MLEGGAWRCTYSKVTAEISHFNSQPLNLPFQTAYQRLEGDNAQYEITCFWFLHCFPLFFYWYSLLSRDHTKSWTTTLLRKQISRKEISRYIYCTSIIFIQYYSISHNRTSTQNKLKMQRYNEIGIVLAKI